MIEYGFRITEEQYRRIGGQLAAGAPEQAVIAECGSGEVSWSENNQRKTWCVSNTSISTDNWQQWLQDRASVDQNICIFTASERVACLPFCTNLQILWAIIADDTAYFGNIRTPIPATSGQRNGSIRTA